MTEKIVKMRVFGMTCEDCTRTVMGGLRVKDGVLDAAVSLGDGTALITIDADKVQPVELESLPVFAGESSYRAQVREVRDKDEG